MKNLKITIFTLIATVLAMFLISNVAFSQDYKVAAKDGTARLTYKDGKSTLNLVNLDHNRQTQFDLYGRYEMISAKIGPIITKVTVREFGSDIKQIFTFHFLSSMIIRDHMVVYPDGSKKKDDSFNPTSRELASR